MVRRISLLLPVLIVGACVPKREAPVPQPRPQPPVQTVPQPQPLPPPPPAADWRDRALSAGGWTYSASSEGSQATFGPAGQAAFLVRCDRARRQVSLGRQGAAGAGPMTMRSSTDARSLPTSIQAQYAWAVVPANDRLLDSLAFSRGRFTVEMPGAPALVIPAWPEPARVVEDCRG